MGFVRRPFRAPAPVRFRASVFAVGSRAYVACTGDRAARAMLMDDAAKSPLANLTDGTEVEILAWRPRGSTGARYCVRRADGLEGWLDVGNLRGTRQAPPPAPPPAVASASAVPSLSRDSTGPARRFGQR